MIKPLKQKSFILITCFLIIVVLIILIGAFLLSSISEKRHTDREKFSLQSLYLAETGINHGLSELKNRIRVVLLENVRTGGGPGGGLDPFVGYVSGGQAGSVQLLCDYAGFNQVGTQAVLDISDSGDVTPLDLQTNVQGNYSAQIRVEASDEPDEPSDNVYVFPFSYTIEGSGEITETTPSTVKSLAFQGEFTVTIQQINLAYFNLHTNHQTTGSLVNPVWFTNYDKFTGPVSTNDRFSFKGNPSAIFTDIVTQHQKKARFHNNNDEILLDADSNEDIDVPEFQNGFTRGVSEMPIESAISKEELARQALGRPGNPPGGGGIFLEHDQNDNLTGGIYIDEGDADIRMESDGDKAIYTISRTKSGGLEETKKITVDYEFNQTTVEHIYVKKGSLEPTTTYNGIPDGEGDEGIIIYSEPIIYSLSGVVNKNSEITIVSENDVRITNDIIYEQYDTDTEGNPTSAEGYTNILGIISYNRVRIAEGAPNDINVHGIVFAPQGTLLADDASESSKGTATLFGGQITKWYGPLGYPETNRGYLRNNVYDERTKEGYAPPYFPYLGGVFISSEDGLEQRPVWKEET